MIFKNSRLNLFLTGISLFATCFSYAGSDSELLRIDVSGSRGVDGQDGYRGSDGGYGGGDGGRGGNAGPATRGGNGGLIDILLSDPNKSAGGKLSGRVVITGQVREAQDANGSYRKEITIGDNGYIHLDASGGAGGNGGRGGDGGAGGEGSRGSDATQWSWGTNGGQGGNGGSGGDGTSGAHGGKGGQIAVSVKPEETGLLMLTEHNVSGGEGGQAGSNGSGGAGGSGGQGGSSYSWTTQESYSCTDADGKSDTCYRTEYHSNPGGSNGYSGNSGSSGNAYITNGDPGRNGHFTIRVIEKDGRTHEYQTRYDMRLLGFEFRGEQDDGVFEPGEEVTVTKIRVKNSGGMPTPTHQKVRVYLDTRGWVLSHGLTLDIPKSLRPGETYTFTKPLKFKIQDTQVGKAADRFVAQDTVRPLALMTDVNRPFTEFENSQNLTITYPIEITPLNVRRSMAPGETASFFWKVKNISKLEFSPTEIKRQITTMLKRDGGDLDPSAISFSDAKGKALDLESGFMSAITSLKPGQSVVIESKVTMGSNAQPYTLAKYSADLKVGQLNKPTVLKQIQFRSVDIRVAQRYFYNADACFVLVTNHRTEQAEIMAWNKLAASLGCRADIWDVSYYGFIKLAQKIANSGSERSMMENYRGKTMVLLNNFIDEPKKEIRETELDSSTSVGAMISPNDVKQAIIKYGMTFYVLGKDGLLDSFNYTSPDDIETLSQHRSVTEFLEKLHGKTASAEMEGDKIQIKEWNVFWSKPSEEGLAARAKKLENELARLHPDRNYKVTYEFDPQMTRKGFFRKEWNYGHLIVVRGADKNTGGVTELPVSDDELHNAAFVIGGQNRFTLFLALPFGEKLALLKHLLEKDNIDAAKSLVNAVMVDIAKEQSLVRSSGWNQGMSGKTVIEKLPNLRLLAASGIKAAPQSKSEEVLIELAGMIHFLAESQCMGWQHFVPNRRDINVSIQTNEILKVFLAGAFGMTKMHLGLTGRHAVVEIPVRVTDAIYKTATTAWFKKLNERVKGSKEHKDIAAMDIFLSPLTADGAERI